MRSKPAVPEVSSALERKLQAVTEMIEEDRQARAGEPAPAPAAEMPAAPVAEPAPVVPTTPSEAEYPEEDDWTPPAYTQLNTRLNADLARELDEYLLSTRGRVKKVQFISLAIRHYLDTVKRKPHAQRPQRDPEAPSAG